MIRKGLILKIFDAAYMQRWNDKLRPIEFSELDKHAHKMFIVYYLGKFEESKHEINWEMLIKYCFYDLLKRIVITDIMPELYEKIENIPEQYDKVKEVIFNSLSDYLLPCGLDNEFYHYLHSEEDVNDIHIKIKNAAHDYATRWEFKILYHINPKGFDMENIQKKLDHKINEYSELKGISLLNEQEENDSFSTNFVNVCGELRYQSRWSHLHRIPKTSVLGHSYFVALLSYLFSKNMKEQCCPERIYNNFFTGLFHDLPEVYTRDIISPVKTNADLKEFLKLEEKNYMNRNLLPTIPEEWHKELILFTQSWEDDSDKRDGRLVEALDKLAVFIEADAAVKNGCPSKEFQKVVVDFTLHNKRPMVPDIGLEELYADFI